MQFEWDESKARSNVAKHGVTFHEAITVFGDQRALTFRDPDHSSTESQFLTFGLSIDGRILAIIHTAREASIRIISARPASRRERTTYDDG
jgi:uncharacterized DUF497 family protein